MYFDSNRFCGTNLSDLMCSCPFTLRLPYPAQGCFDVMGITDCYGLITYERLNVCSAYKNSYDVFTHINKININVYELKYGMP